MELVYLHEINYCICMQLYSVLVRPGEQYCTMLAYYMCRVSVNEWREMVRYNENDCQFVIVCSI